MARPRKTDADWDADWAALLYASILFHTEGDPSPTLAMIACRAGLSERTALRVMDRVYAGTEGAAEIQAAFRFESESKAVSQLRATGISQRECAKRMGRSRRWVRDHWGPG